MRNGFITVTDPGSEYCDVIGRVHGEDDDRVVVSFGDPIPRYHFFSKEDVRLLPEPNGIIQRIPFINIPREITVQMFKQTIRRLCRIGLNYRVDSDEQVLFVQRKPA